MAMIGGYGSPTRFDSPTMARPTMPRYPRTPQPGRYDSPGPVGQIPRPKQGNPAPVPGNTGQKTTIDPYNYQGDPLLQRVIGQNVRDLGLAAGNKTDAQKRELLGFGSVELARKLFGNDEAFLQTVGNNPFSTIANTKYQYEDPHQGLMNQAKEAANNQNLFFSSELWNNQLPALGRAEQQQIATGSTAVEKALQTINQGYLDQQMQAQEQENEAQRDAASRAMTAALASGWGPGAANSAGGTPKAPVTTVGSVPPRNYTLPRPYGPEY